MSHALLVLTAVFVLVAPPPGFAESPPETTPLRDDGDPEAPPAVPAEELERLRAEVRHLRGRLDLLEEGLAASRVGRQVYALPEPVAFAGQTVPLARWDVRERLEREFFKALGDWAQVVLWLKRSARYFPYVEEALARAALPDDLKYVAVVESALLPTAYSPASALGIWQFMSATARRYGLAVTPWWDERRNPEASTRAALAYLKDLHARFGDWPLALAGYNAGEGRIAHALSTQRVTTYYQLALPQETERYVLRVFAAKLILSDPARHGFELATEQRYRPVQADTVEVDLRGRTSVTDLAVAARSFYREMKGLNPEVMQEWLPKGRYAIRVPRGHAEGLAARLAVVGPTESEPIRYEVKRGDTLRAIAERFGVPASALEARNKGARSRLVPGAVLLIPRPASR